MAWNPPGTPYRLRLYLWDRLWGHARVFFSNNPSVKVQGAGHTGFALDYSGFSGGWGGIWCETRSRWFSDRRATAGSGAECRGGLPVGRWGWGPTGMLVAPPAEAPLYCEVPAQTLGCPAGCHP